MMKNELKEKQPIKDLKILIVEDDPTSVMMLGIMIEDFCKDPLIGFNGLEAVQLCKDEPRH